MNHTVISFILLSFVMHGSYIHAADKPNVLFIVCDDLNVHIAPDGYKHISTPTLDKLAHESLLFRNAYCQYPVCGPSRASFLHGLYPESTGVLDNVVDIKQTRPNTVSLPVSFRQAGYWTAAVGKVFHHAGDNPNDSAWDLVEKYENDEMPIIRDARIAFEKEHGLITDKKNKKVWKEHLKNVATQTRNQGGDGYSPGYGPSGLSDEQHKDGKNVRTVAEWLTNKKYGDKPFMIACGIQKPHIPFLAPHAYYNQYPKESLQYNLDPSDDWSDIPALAEVKGYKNWGFTLGQENEPLRRDFTQAYHACISFIDAQLQLVFTALHESGQWENTIIVFTSDHGYHLGEHFLWGKVTLFQESARVPLMMRVPGITKPGTFHDGIVELVDLYPTLMALCHISPPSNLQGTSLVAQLKDPSLPGKDVAYTVVTRGNKMGRAIRFAHWRYTEWGSSEYAELYDLNEDPRELINLAKLPAFSTTVAQAHDLLIETHKRAGALATTNSQEK